MKKIILILSAIFLLVAANSCRTKKVIKNESKQVEKTEVKEAVKVQQQEVKKESEEKQEQEKKTEEKSEEKQEVNITGKVDDKNPLTFYNVVNGDTIDLFKVTGNADVIFKSSKNNSNSFSSSENNSKILKESEQKKESGSIIEKATETVKEVQTKSVEVVKKNMTFGVYLTFFLWGLAVIAILVFIIWLRKSTYWTKILTFFKIKKS